MADGAHASTVQTLWMGDVPAQPPNPRAEEDSELTLWLWLQTLLQFSSENCRKESSQNHPEDALCISGALQESRKRSRRASRRTDPLHCRGGHVLWSLKGQCRVNMLTCLEKAKPSLPTRKPQFLPATFPTRVFHSFLNFFIIF